VRLERRALFTLAVLAALAPVAIAAFGSRGLAVYVAAWMLALPLLLPELRGFMRDERVGVLFVFLTACSADYVDAAFGLEQRVTVMLVTASLVYLVMRRTVAWELLRTAPLVVLALFFAQQVLSAALLNPDDLWLVVSGRASVLAAALVGAVLVRRDASGRALPALVLLGAIVSVPVMVLEIVWPDLVLFPTQEMPREMRAGGLFAQPNNVGTALTFAAAFLLALYDRGEIRRRAVAIFAALIAVGVIACASRGALVIVVLLGGASAALATWRRVGRVPLASGLIIVGLLAVTLPPIGRGLGQLSTRADDVGPLPTARLGEVALLLSGDTEDLADDDSSRGKLAAEAWRLIVERPLFGRGTGNFAVEPGPHGRRSHVQFLDVLGENGAVGGALYLLLLLGLARAVARVPVAQRFGAALAVGVWFLTGLDKHNTLEYRFMVLPLAYAAGLTPTARRAIALSPGGDGARGARPAPR
jgi:O-antigen ligase